MFPTFISNIQRNVSLPGFLQVCFKALADLFPNLFCQRQPKSFFFLCCFKSLSLSVSQGTKISSAIRWWDFQPLGPPVSAPLPKKKFPSQRFVVKFQKLFCQPFLCNVSLPGFLPKIVRVQRPSRFKHNPFQKASAKFFCQSSLWFFLCWYSKPLRHSNISRHQFACANKFSSSVYQYFWKTFLPNISLRFLNEILPISVRFVVRFQSIFLRYVKPISS